MADIFISHAVVDKKLAKLFVRFLMEAIGVPTDSIFCSSIPDNGIPVGEDFNSYIKDQLQAPKLILVLMTPAYMESAFCLMELGAAWAQDHQTLAIVVPPTSFDNVTRTLGLRQALKIDDAAGPVELRKKIKAAGVALEKRGEHAWDDKRAEWRADLKKVIRDLSPAAKVLAQDYKAATDTVTAQAEEIENLEGTLTRLRARVTKLESLKDAAEVRELKREDAGVDALEAEFEELLEAVAEARPSKASNAVFKHIIMDHFGKARQIDWYATSRDEFEAAVEYNLLETDPPHQVRWGSGKLPKLRKALSAIATFVEGADGLRLAATQDDDVSMEPDDLAFWEWHLTI